MRCQFCNDDESIHHLFFHCPAAKYVWSTVARAVSAPERPGSFSQNIWWIPRFLLISRNVQITLVAAVCWAIWKTCNNACFEGELIKKHNELICYLYVFVKYWTGLHNAAEQEDLHAGTDTLMNLATTSNVSGTLLVIGSWEVQIRMIEEKEQEKASGTFGF